MPYLATLNVCRAPNLVRWSGAKLWMVYQAGTKDRVIVGFEGISGYRSHK